MATATKKKRPVVKVKSSTAGILDEQRIFMPDRDEVGKYVLKASLTGTGDWTSTAVAQKNLLTMTFQEFWDRYAGYSQRNQGKGKYLSLADEMLKRFPPVIKEAVAASEIMRA